MHMINSEFKASQSNFDFEFNYEEAEIRGLFFVTELMYTCCVCVLKIK